VEFTVDAFPSRTFRGKVVQIRNSPTTVQNVVTYDTVVGVDNADLKLRPGMTANATIITARRDGVLKIPNAALRFRMPEPSTNKSFFAKLFSGGDSGKDKAATNAVAAMKAGDTNAVAAAGGKPAPLTGNEPPDELFRRVREMRERGEAVPPEIRTKLREYFQSGVLQRPAGGGGGGGAGVRNSSQPTTHTVYVLVAEAPGKDAEPKPVKVKTGINDGAFTEVLEGLKEGDVVVTSVRLRTQDSTPAAQNPFGGPGSGGGRRR
jgi:HlyD family secretion protein